MSIEINTKRLNLHLLKLQDIDNLTALNSDPKVREFFPDGPQNKEQTEAKMKRFISEYENSGLPCFVIVLSESGEFVGQCGFGPIETGEIEVGYILHKKFWNQGYASEVLVALLEWAKKNIKAEYIIAFAPTEHIVSQRVMQKCGMEHYKDEMGKGVPCRFYRIKNR